jgi:Leucine-rich repeat (LRR) protein
VRIPKVVLTLSKLYCLKLKNTQLIEVPDNLVKCLPDLEEIDLEKNDVRSLPLSLASAKKLKKLKYDKDKVVLPVELRMVV